MDSRGQARSPLEISTRSKLVENGIRVLKKVTPLLLLDVTEGAASVLD
jgi:hypothetical protein